MWPLHYIGHPMFDVGLAALTAYSRKPDSAKLTEVDLEDIASFIKCYYIDTSPYDAQIRSVQSNEAKNVTLEEEAVDRRGGSDRI